ncbi:response regulator transcription factor [Leeia oryzae]|uniref:response regulator transcription factor n=1 Tax=Leeia oryzae TaxID=356662 RepID=UPI0003769C8A|nr:response regulator transcription factor [Leeia oryzae]
MPSRLNIILVEDNDDLREATIDVLLAEGHRVIGAASAEDINDLQTTIIPELYILDLNLPGEDGMTLAKRLRHANTHIGIIMVTARHQIQDQVAGYDAGADIYLTKPIDPDVLLATIASLARRLKPQTQQPHSLVLNSQRLRLTGPNGHCDLSQNEAKVLISLAQAPEQMLERWQVMVNFGQYEVNFNEASLEVRLSGLRKKLRTVGAQDNCLKAIRGVGYKLCVPITIA